DRFLGSVVRLLTKMTRILLSFVAVFIVFWITYAVTILSLIGDPLNFDKLLWNFFENGAFEIFADFKEDKMEGRIKSCTDSRKSSSFEIWVDCLIRSWLIPISLFVYVLVSSIVLINLITSFLTSSYEELKSDSTSEEEEVNYEFYRRLEEYRRKPCFPPPLTFISMLLLLLEYC
ncbi:hypothetical protein PMAYCL1PPCAC_03316, partial [Pristionchus mayeri]